MRAMIFFNEAKTVERVKSQRNEVGKLAFLIRSLYVSDVGFNCKCITVRSKLLFSRHFLVACTVGINKCVA